MCDFWSQCYEKFRLIFPKTPRIPKSMAPLGHKYHALAFASFSNFSQHIYHFAATSFQSSQTNPTETNQQPEERKPSQLPTSLPNIPFLTSSSSFNLSSFLFHHLNFPLPAISCSSCKSFPGNHEQLENQKIPLSRRIRNTSWLE